MQVSHRYKFLSLAIPATASVSTLRTFKKYVDIPHSRDMSSIYYHHAEPLDIENAIPDLWNSYFKFCFVRNPWDRIVSHYFSSTQGDVHGRTYEFARGMSFDQFIERHVMTEKENKHVFPNRCLMCKDLSTWYSGVDYIGRFENYEESIYDIFRKVGINEEPVIHHLNTTQHEDYRNYYNDRTVMMVYEKYRDEIEYLGYDFE